MTAEELIDLASSSAPCTAAGVAALAARVNVAGDALGTARAALATAESAQLKLSTQAARVSDALEILSQQQRLAAMNARKKSLSIIGSQQTGLAVALAKIGQDQLFLAEQKAALLEGLETCAQENKLLNIRKIESQLSALKAESDWTLASAFLAIVEMQLALAPAVLLDPELSVTCDSSSAPFGFSRRLAELAMETMELRRNLEKEKDQYVES
jgi:hypothetical protein